MVFEEKNNIQAKPEKIFSLYEDVENWPSWDPEIETSFLNGDFKVGATGILKPRNGIKCSFVITEVTQNMSFTMKVKLPLCSIDFVHEIIPVYAGSDVIHRMVFSGMLASIFGRLVGKKIANEQASTLKALETATTKPPTN